MARSFAILLIAAAASAWASAQPPTAGPITGDRLRLMQKNHELLEALVTRTVALANANTAIARAKVCRQTADDLRQELKQAVQADNADRVAELTEYLADVLEHGLTAEVKTAGYPRGSRDEQDLMQLREDAAAEAVQAHDSLPHIGKVGQSTLVSAARRRLAAAHTQLVTADPAAGR